MSQCVDTARADACSAELTAISDALGTNEGHSSVDNIRLLKAEMEQLKKELGEACKVATIARDKAESEIARLTVLSVMLLQDSPRR